MRCIHMSQSAVFSGVYRGWLCISSRTHTYDYRTTPENNDNRDVYSLFFTEHQQISHIYIYIYIYGCPDRRRRETYSWAVPLLIRSSRTHRVPPVAIIRPVSRTFVGLRVSQQRHSSRPRWPPPLACLGVFDARTFVFLPLAQILDEGSAIWPRAHSARASV